MKDSDEIKFLPVSKGDLILSLDRLTRFKYPEFKYYRVLNELLAKYLLSPKLNKSKLEKLDIHTYITYVEKIWNASVKHHTGKKPSTFLINELIVDEEFNSYNLSDDLKLLIKAKLNYDDVLTLIRKDSALPLNLKRLIIYKEKMADKKELREKYLLKFPIEKVVLCEGITEEILLPEFGAKLGYDFREHGIHLISAGGKNQVAKLYCELRDELKLPIFVLLDADADQTCASINCILRKKDKIHLIKHGEFEDLFSLFLIKRTINNKFKNILQCNVEDFKSCMPMTKVLCEYFRINNLGDFQKAEFAKEIAQNIKSKSDLMPEIIEIIDEIETL